MGPVQEGSVITVSLSPLKWEEHESFIEYLLCTRTLYIRCHSRYARWVLHPFYRWYLKRLHSCTCHIGSKWQSCGLLVCVCARVLYKRAFMCWREKRGLSFCWETIIVTWEWWSIIGNTYHWFRIDFLIWFKLVNRSLLFDSNSHCYSIC